MDTYVINTINSSTTDIENTMRLIKLGLSMGWITDVPQLQTALSEIGFIIEKQVFPIIDTQKDNSNDS